MTKAKRNPITSAPQNSKSVQSAFLDVQDEFNNFHLKVEALFDLLSAANKNSLGDRTLDSIGEIGLQLAEHFRSAMDERVAALKSALDAAPSI